MSRLILLLKLIALIAFTTVILFIKDWRIISVIFIGTVVMIIPFKINHLFRQRIYPLIFIGGFIILFQLLFNWHVPLMIRVIAGIVNAEKIISLSLAVFIYSATTSFNELIKTLSFLPKNVNLMLTIALSMLTIMLDEIRKISLVQNSRGLSHKSLNPKKSIFPIIIPLLYRSFTRAEKIALLLYTREYTD